MSQSLSAPGSGAQSAIVQRLQHWIDGFARRATVDDEGRIRIHARQIYILPTRFGMLFAVMLVAMLIGANNYGSNPGFLFTFLLAGLGMAALFQTWKNILGLELNAARAEPVFLGGPASFSLTLGNPTRVPKAGIVMRLHRVRTSHTDRLDIDPGKTGNGSIGLPTRFRGWLILPCVVIESVFPLGLFRAWAYIDINHRCLVYPKPAPIGSGVDQAAAIPNDATSATVDGDDFAGHRAYLTGDNMHHVDWKVVARGKGWHTKQFTAGRGEQVWLRLALADGQDIEQRLAAVTRSILDLERGSTRYGLDTGDCSIAPANGVFHRNACLKQLALVNLPRARQENGN